MQRSVWISEEEESDEEGASFWTGRFRAHEQLDDGIGATLEDVDLATALSWARSRAPMVVVSIGDADRYSAGERPVPELAPWPFDEVPTTPRRRFADEAWMDRTEADDPIAWSVTAWLAPPLYGAGGEVLLDGIEDRQAGWRREVSAVAARARADWWSSRGLNDFVRELRRLTSDAASGLAGWTLSGRPAYELRFSVRAATAGGADAAVRGRIAVPPGWDLELDCLPA